jgi:formate dehydrogenase (coenzyme F420) beta subunit
MNALPQHIRKQIADWLANGEIELFIGYEPGTLPLRATPAFIRKPEDVERLIWDATCENNLAVFLPKYKGKKVGILVKGCDARAVVGLLQEGQVQRDKLRIVGVRCPGVVDVRLVAAKLGVPVEDIEDGRVLGDEVAGDEVVVGETHMPLLDVIHRVCRTCTQHNPNVYDVVFGREQSDEPHEEPYAHVRAMEALNAAERWQRFEQELKKCNLCFACRNACPLCYCNQCFADCSQPRWVTQTERPEDVQFFQVMRTFHLAGRCVGCGACTRACPQGVDLRQFLDKLRADTDELYGYVAGADPDTKPPLTTYREDDYNDFVM